MCIEMGWFEITRIQITWDINNLHWNYLSKLLMLKLLVKITYVKITCRNYLSKLLVEITCTKITCIEIIGHKTKRVFWVCNLKKKILLKVNAVKVGIGAARWSYLYGWSASNLHENGPVFCTFSPYVLLKCFRNGHGVGGVLMCCVCVRCFLWSVLKFYT